MNPLAIWGLSIFTAGAAGAAVICIMLLIGPLGDDRELAIKNAIFYIGVGAYILGLVLLIVDAMIRPLS